MYPRQLRLLVPTVITRLPPAYISQIYTKSTIPAAPQGHIQTTSTLCIANCQYSQEAAAPPVVDFDYVTKAVNNNNILIIDVREPDEVKELGKIPNSINIPLGTVASVLGTMSDREFKSTYGKEKPKDNAEIIVYCMKGVRSGMAQKEATTIGFKNVKNYVGSWTNWASKIQ